MGRPKKDKAKFAQNNASDFDVNFEDQLKKLEQKNDVKIDKEILKKYDIRQVSRIRDLSGAQIRHFNKDNYEESIKSATEWRDSYNSNSDNNTIIEIVGFYPQIFKHKSIIVSYNIKSKLKVDGNWPLTLELRYDIINTLMSQTPVHQDHLGVIGLCRHNLTWGGDDKKMDM